MGTVEGGKKRGLCQFIDNNLVDTCSLVVYGIHLVARDVGQLMIVLALSEDRKVSISGSLS